MREVAKRKAKTMNARMMTTDNYPEQLAYYTALVPQYNDDKLKARFKYSSKLKKQFSIRMPGRAEHDVMELEMKRRGLNK